MTSMAHPTRPADDISNRPGNKSQSTQDFHPSTNQSPQDKLLLAAHQGNHAIVENLLRKSKGANANARGPPPPGKFNNNTDNVVRTKSNDSSTIKLEYTYFGKKQESYVKAGDVGRTALQVAAELGHDEVVNVLLKYKADVNAAAASIFGRTALQAAAEGGHETIVQQLLQYHADVSASPARVSGRTALQAAAGKGNIRILKLLLEAYVRTSVQPMLVEGHQRMIKLLEGDAENSEAPGSMNTEIKAALEDIYQTVTRLLDCREGSADVEKESPTAELRQNTTSLPASPVINEEHQDAIGSKGSKRETDLGVGPVTEKYRIALLKEAVKEGHNRMMKLLKDVTEESVPESKTTFSESVINETDIPPRLGCQRVMNLFRLEGHADIRASELSGRTTSSTAPLIYYTLKDALVEEYQKVMTILDAAVNEPPSPQSGKTCLLSALVGGNGENNKNMHMVNLLLSEGADVNSPPDEVGGMTALQYAAHMGLEQVVELLIEKGADVNAAPASSYGSTALQAAAEKGYKTIVKKLLGQHANVNLLPAASAGRTALQAAAQGGHEEVIEILLEAGANVNAPPAETDGRTALQAAAGFITEDTALRLVELLLEKGADVNALPAYNFGKTALQAASERAHETIVTLLLEHEANVNVKAEMHGGRTALQAAAEGRREEPGQQNDQQNDQQRNSSELHRKNVVQLLIDNGADVNAEAAQFSGRTALQAAAFSGFENVVQLLLVAKADVNKYTIDEITGDIVTPLELAASKGHKKIVDILVRAGADIDLPRDPETTGEKGNPEEDPQGRTALQAAAQNGHLDTVKLLVDGRAVIDAPGGKGLGWTALQAAAAGGHLDVVKLLLSKNANVNESAKDDSVDGMTALQAASKGGHLDIVELLVKEGAHIDAPGGRKGLGWTALQAAAAGGHLEIVELLLSKNASVNEPPNDSGYGMTALQAAAKGGHENVLKILLKKGAEVNSKAAREGTALQMASKGGHESIVGILLEKGADVNASPAFSNRLTALQAATIIGNERIVKMLLERRAKVGRQCEDRISENTPPSSPLGAAVLMGNNIRVLKILLSAGAKTEDTNEDARNFLHSMARTGDGCYMLAPLLDGIGRQYVKKLAEMTSPKSTPLHIATAYGRLSMVKNLVACGFQMESRDGYGNTPLQIALETGYWGIVQYLIESGANPECLAFGQLKQFMKAYKFKLGNPKNSNCGIVIFVKEKTRNILRLDKEMLAVGRVNADMYFDKKNREILDSERSLSAVLPMALKENGTHKRLRPYERGRYSQIWWFSKTTRHFNSLSTDYDDGIISMDDVLSAPNDQEIYLFGYLRFTLPEISFEEARKQAMSKPNSTEMTRDPPPPFKLSDTEVQDIEILWMMARDREIVGDKSKISYKLASKHYQGNLELETLAIPVNGVHFACVLLGDLNSRWMKLITKAKQHLEKVRDHQLATGHDFPNLSECLTTDSQTWNLLRDNWRAHVKSAEDLLKMFEDHDVLSHELGHSLPGKKRIKLGDLLKEKLAYLKKECDEGIMGLERETKQLVSLEFNLSTTYDTRRSIQMAEQSNEMAASMKRLSWITFIFLPLMFISGIFGMNVDLLSSNPSWLWYLITAIPFMMVLITITITCKFAGDFLKKRSQQKSEIASQTTTELEKKNHTTYSRFTKARIILLGVHNSVTGIIHRRKNRVTEDLERNQASIQKDETSQSGGKIATETNRRITNPHYKVIKHGKNKIT